MPVATPISGGENGQPQNGIENGAVVSPQNKNSHKKHKVRNFVYIFFVNFEIFS